MDMLIIKHHAGDTLGDEIGRFFRTHNVIEYKSPEDSLSVDDFYKAQGYALLYKGLGKKVNEIPIEELTVSIFRHSYPREMFAALEKSGLKVENPFPGVYYVTGATSVRTQVIVTSRLAEGTYPAFKVLAKGFSREDVEQLLMTAKERNDPHYTDYVKAVLNVSIAVDKPVFESMKREGSAMSGAVESLFAEEIAEHEKKGRLDTLFGLVKDNILSVSDAAKRADMDVPDFEKAYKAYCR